MGFFDVIAAPFKGVGKLVGGALDVPVIGDALKIAPGVVLGPAGIPVSAGLGALDASTGPDKGGFFNGMLGGAASGAAGFGLGKVPWGDILKSGAGAFGFGGPASGGVPGAVASGGLDLGHGVVVPAAVNAAAPAAAAGGAGAIPGALKWGSLLTGAANLAGTGYDVYSGERAAKRARRLGGMVQPGFEDRLAVSRERLGTRTDREAEAERRRREQIERLRGGLSDIPLSITRGY